MEARLKWERKEESVMRRSRGLSLGGVLLAGLVLSVLVLGLTRLSVAHLWLSTRSNTTLNASSLVNSAASAAMAKVLEKATYGPSDPDIVLERPQGRAVVTFSPERGRALQVPHSTNNLNGTSPVEGYQGRVVAAGTALVIATCEFGGSRRQVEAVLHAPPFPWAIVAGGTLQTKERVLIGSIPEGAWPPPPDDELLPADVLANSTDSRAIVLSGQCSVLGDVESPGGIVLEGREVSVKGEVRPGSAPIKVPQLEATKYDPEAMGLDFDDLSQLDTSADVVPIQGAAKKRGDLEVNGLRLEGGQLYVEGNLTVRGSVTGTGALICTGNLDLQGLKLDSATELAVLADGQVDLRGTGPVASAVKGLFYAGGGLSAKDLTVVGTVVAGRAQGQVELENARVLSEPAPAPVPEGDGTYYIGESTPLPPGQTGRAPANLTRISLQRPDYSYGFSLKVQRTNPQQSYPVTISVGTGFVITSPRSFTLNRPQDIQRVINFFSNSFESGRLVSNRTVNLPRIDTEGFFRSLLGNAISPEGLSEVGGLAVNLEGELSRFLPFEERVRVLSWVER